MHFVEDGGYDEDSYGGEDETELEECHGDGEPSGADAEEALVVLHEGFEHVGHEPCHEEG